MWVFNERTARRSHSTSRFGFLSRRPGRRLITDGLSLGVGSQKLSLYKVLFKISLRGYSQQMIFCEVSYKIIFGEIYYDDELYSTPQCLGSYGRKVLVAACVIVVGSP